MPHKNRHNHYLPTVAEEVGGTQLPSRLWATRIRDGGHFSKAELLTWRTPGLPRGTWQPAPTAAAADRASPLAPARQRSARLAAGPGAESETPSGALQGRLAAGGNTVLLACSLPRT